MSDLMSFSMSTSIIIEAPAGPTQSVFTAYDSTSPTAPGAIFTGRPSTHAAPEYTGPASTTGPPSSGLSAGVKAGVGVGVVVGVLVLAGLLWFAYALGKRRSRAAPSQPPQYDSVVHEEGKQSKATLYSVDSAMFVEKASVTEKAHDTEKSYASDAKV